MAQIDRPEPPGGLGLLVVRTSVGASSLEVHPRSTRHPGRVGTNVQTRSRGDHAAEPSVIARARAADLDSTVDEMQQHTSAAEPSTRSLQRQRGWTAHVPRS